ncbi:hypothetical protein TI05_09805 [Achromatium sp. WMS3]|nr:hypothetical protein TI05_09805 [Achromatium sp. WMS3]
MKNERHLKDMTNDTSPFYAFLILIGALFIGFIAGGTAQIAAATFTIKTSLVPKELLQAIDTVYKQETAKAEAPQIVQQPKVRKLRSAKSAVNDEPWGLDVKRSLFVGASSLVGIMAFNYITSGSVMGSIAAIPTATGMGTQVAVAESSAVTAVGVYGILSALFGAVIGNNLYNSIQQDASVQLP